MTAGAHLSPQYKQTPLHIAARHGFAELCAQLLEKGADLMLATNQHECTSLHLAAQRGHAGRHLVPGLLARPFFLLV